MALNVAFAIDLWQEDVVLKTRGPNTYNSTGDIAVSYLPDVTIKAMVVPATGKTLQEVPEGMRDEAQLVLWTRVDLTTDDEIEYLNDRYRLLTVEKWTQGAYNKAILGGLSD